MSGRRSSTTEAQHYAFGSDHQAPAKAGNLLARQLTDRACHRDRSYRAVVLVENRCRDAAEAADVLSIIDGIAVARRTFEVFKECSPITQGARRLPYKRSAQQRARLDLWFAGQDGLAQSGTVGRNLLPGCGGLATRHETIEKPSFQTIQDGQVDSHVVVSAKLADQPLRYTHNVARCTEICAYIKSRGTDRPMVGLSIEANEASLLHGCKQTQTGGGRESLILAYLGELEATCGET